ncbi:zinc finger protein 423 [Phymastichus coffea]|uniref:zinc finger protein 423 n=1 Tax=Phymastichus coffea TaxID=108790 RepID=UPI00273C97F7|nr:zinc finger protein 423 [Phymastichus coffea]
MSSSQETCLAAESTEIDSEGSSGEERAGGGRCLRRPFPGAGSDADGLPKKRRKQSTPVKFSTSLSLASAECGDESEEDAATDEGKPTPSPPTSSTHSKPPTLKDENLNNEFRCQLCSQFSDSRAALELHLECDHQGAFAQQRESSPEQPISPVNLSGVSIRNFAATAWGQLQQQQQQQQQQPQQQQAAAARNNNHFSAMPSFPSHFAQFLPIAGFPVPDPAQIQRAAMGQLQPPKIFNLDAYCELCNKEFCNKYFLKTHKANKHGIYSDPPASQSGQGSNDGAPSSPFIATSPIANLTASVNQPHRIENNGVQMQQQQLALACDLCPKRFKNEDSLRKHQRKIHFSQNREVDSPATSSIPMSLPSSSGEEERQSPAGIESLFKQEISIDQDEASYPSTPGASTVSPASAPQLKDSLVNGDRLRRIGVMNPEAFCELCCKEYCNKYFLRTHKLKRHGIFIPDDKSAPAPGSAASWHQVQTSPLNLIVDSVGNGSESEDRADECSCKSCGIRFQTQELHNLHMEKIHDGAAPAGQLSPKLEQEAEAADRSDSISEDLQKLQTMILQLNNLESNKAASCALCGKDYDCPDALRSHMVLEHKVVPENLSSPSQPASRDKSSPGGGASSSTSCALCEKEYPSQEALRRHVAEDHQPSTPTSSTPQLASPAPATPKSGSSQPPERKPVASITPTSSYCEICNKELCNKYFMKTHMQKMHGIEIENGAQIGGVVCNICKKELCSKYFLRVHKQNTHGIVEEGAPSVGKQDHSECSSSAEDVALRPEQLGDVNIRYITHFTEVCPICNRRFRSPKWLKAHLQTEHGEAGHLKWREIEQYQQTVPRTGGRASGSSKQHHPSATLRIPNGFEPSPQMRSDLAALNNQVLSNFFGNSTDDQPVQTYRCSQPLCNFSTQILALFFLHERSHSHQQESAALESERAIQCPICSQSFSQLEQLRQHVASRHPSPFPGLLSQFPIPLLGDFGLAGEQQQQQQQQQQHQHQHHHQPDRIDYPEPKEDVRQASPLQTKSELEASKTPKQDDSNAVHVMPQGAYKCFQCGFTTANLNRIKKHIKKDHKSLGDPQETALAELTKTLKDVANKHKVPASYAMPQDTSLSGDKLIMQPFMIEEQSAIGNNGCGNGDESPRRFAPALVFLPVKARLGNSLSITFSLNPA